MSILHHIAVKFGITIDLRHTQLTTLLKVLIGLFSGKNVYEQVELFNKTLLNIFYNFILNKIILCDDKDPPWMNDETKTLIKRKNRLFQRQRKSGNLDHASLNSVTQDLSNPVNSSKLKYHERLALRLHNPKTAPKTYWKILKAFVNGTKIPIIRPLLAGNLYQDFGKSKFVLMFILVNNVRH